jgi:anti-anti-sigma factor
VSAPLVINERNHEGVTVLELDGRLVFEVEHEFRERVTSLVASGNKHILVNLNEVSYIDSAGVGSLVAMFLHVLKRGGRLKLIRPSERASRVLEIAQLLSIFDVFESEAQGILAFAPATSKKPSKGLTVDSDDD